ncbi:sensor histidine kinase [Rhizomonospora bruguierae]|uniref:sensor histidine kinase n=1 Tax=Rhizomonospora bruguierae TaxID=1581705 RepID=UPI001BCB70BC|nr:HAMP domain-containing sensor histidine kinase [Micromonospora sp. NBRC 107566]
MAPPVALWRRLDRWWRRRTLRDRLALLVTGAVAVAVLGLAGVAWGAVSIILHRQVESELTADGRTIAAEPEQWRAAPGRPGKSGQRENRRRLHRELGSRWQILARDGAVTSAVAAEPLPVTDGARRVAAGRADRFEERVRIDDDTYRMLTLPARGGGAVQVAVSEEPTTTFLTAFAVLLAAGCAVGIATAALLGRMVARAGLAPVQHLTEAVEGVAATMDLTRPVPVSGEDEIARLARSVNTLLVAIDSARRAQRTLVEDASHELRTPLTSIRTNIELLLTIERQPELAHRLPPEERAKLLRDLDAQLVELTTLTSELVELAREEATRETPERVDLADVVEAAVARVRIRAPAVTVATDLRPVAVHGRPGELERMVLNVLDNAAKWSPAGATVRTTLRRENAGHAVLTVADTGPGIDPVDLPHVFERFYRATAARGTPGSGLGLAIVAQTAGQHGGTVTAGPNAPHGTIVTIRLPALPVT